MTIDYKYYYYKYKALKYYLKKKDIKIKAGSVFVNLNNIKTLNIINDDIRNKFEENKHTLNKNNLGQHNCGTIVIEDKFFFKCDEISKKNSIEEKIDIILLNNLQEYFTTFYRYTEQNLFFIENKNNLFFLIMEKMNYDLQQIIIKIVAKLTNIDINILVEYLPNTIKDESNRDIDFIKRNNLLQNIKTKNINEKLIDEIIKININLIELHHNLLKRGFCYSDYKFDNIGVNNIDVNDTKQYKFLDLESGFKQILSKHETKDFYIESQLIYFYKSTNILNYKINGQYNLSLFGINIIDYPYEIQTKEELLFEQDLYYNENNKTIYLIGSKNNDFNYDYFKKFSEEIFLIIFVDDTDAKIEYNTIRYKIYTIILKDFIFNNYCLTLDSRHFHTLPYSFYCQKLYNVTPENIVYRLILRNEKEEDQKEQIIYDKIIFINKNEKLELKNISDSVYEIINSN